FIGAGLLHSRSHPPVSYCSASRGSGIITTGGQAAVRGRSLLKALISSSGPRRRRYRSTSRFRGSEAPSIARNCHIRYRFDMNGTITSPVHPCLLVFLVLVFVACSPPTSAQAELAVGAVSKVMGQAQI